MSNQEKNKTEPKTLYLVATPIGNLADISERARKVLSEVDFIAAEDTRNTLKLGELRLSNLKSLCKSYDIRKVLRACAVALFLAAAVDQIGKNGSLADEEHTDALGRMDLMAGHSQHVHGKLREIDLHVSERLHGIRKHQSPLGVCQLADLLDRSLHRCRIDHDPLPP